MLATRPAAPPLLAHYRGVAALGKAAQALKSAVDLFGPFGLQVAINDAVGGAQAVAALAYGVPEIPAVDKIVGPGNLFVALAKRHVFGQVDIG